MEPLAHHFPEDPSLLQRAAAHFHARLKASPIALQHLKWRGKVAAQIVEHFHLGLSDGTLVEALVAQAQDARSVRSALISAGVVRSSGDERFAGSLVVPVFDAEGRVVQLRGGEYHVITGRNTNERFCPHDVDAVFHPRAFELNEELILAGSSMDALRFWCAGHTNVTALGEGGALTDALLAAMKAAKTKRAVIALGSSAKSDANALEAAGRLTSARIDAYRATVVRRFMPTSRQWGELLRDAEPMLGAPKRPEIPQVGLEWSRISKEEAR